MSATAPRGLDHPHDLHDPSTFTNPSPQRQQQQPQPPSDPAFASSPHPAPPRPSSASDTARPLRLPPRFESRPSSHRRAVSVDAAALQNPDLRSVQPAVPGSAQQRGLSAADIAPALSEAETEGDASTAPDTFNPPLESYWPPRSTRVSPRTRSAILWVLEEAIRKPFPFTPDEEELNASMSELVGGGGSSGTAGNARVQNGGSRPAQGPVPVHAHHPAGVRTPTDIMRQRRDREARKKAEKEAREREQQEAELRQQQEQEQKQQMQAQQYAAAGVATGDSATQRAPVNVSTGFQQAATGTRRPDDPRVAGNGAATQRPSTVSQGQPRPVVSSSQQQPIPTTTTPGAFPSQQQQQQPQSQMRGAAPPSQGGPQPGPSTSQRPQAQATQSSQSAGQSQGQPRRSTFPHAFERWETLSSHWEGLTSYWIRKLEQNNEELSRDPLNQQMARQINDLSAAGANLFHAVVELQRLRASSERKFQRWFFDTRAEQERAREIQADLERQLKAAQLEKADALALRQKAEADRKKAEDLVKEMRRELQISKEEARRAWEELGRREQEERERTASLRNGEPTLVGGVQVVPMIQGVPSRQTTSNRPPTREGPYSGGPGPTSLGGQAPHESTEEGQYYEEQRASPTETDPFTENRRPAQQPSSQPPSSSAAFSGGQTATSQGQPTERFYQHEGSALHGEPPTSEPDDRSYVPSNEGSEIGEEEFVLNPDGSYRRDAQGRRMVYTRRMPEDSEEYGGQIEEESGYDHGGSAPATSGAPHHGYGYGSVDYSGSSWGPGTGWESVIPRHRHPTRLSDVIEEDETSRASQASRH